eukprot:GGOE01042497.1.p1 GENE.GGOE01042497.1~~GGOE01042497.1.p1  ORF type:complete len:322 (-),score=98.89 GGOE01042497.1:123-1088(-)
MAMFDNDDNVLLPIPELGMGGEDEEEVVPHLAAILHLVNDLEEQLLVDKEDRSSERLQGLLWPPVDGVDLVVDPHLVSGFVYTDSIQAVDVAKTLVPREEQGTANMVMGAAQVAEEIACDIVERSMVGLLHPAVAATIDELSVSTAKEESAPALVPEPVTDTQPSTEAPACIVPVTGKASPQGSGPVVSLWFKTMERLVQREKQARRILARQEALLSSALLVPLRRAVSRHGRLLELQESLRGHLSGPHTVCTKGLRDALKDRHVELLRQRRQEAAAKHSMQLHAALFKVQEELRAHAAVRDFLRSITPIARRCTTDAQPE